MSTIKGRRQLAELVFPGVAIGLGAGLLAGGVAALAGLPAGYAAATTLTLGLPLGVFGMGYSLLLANGRLRLGGVAPAALYWLFFFPIARLLHEVGFDVVSGNPIALPDALLPFLAYQALISSGFAIGFIWIHEHAFPYWWVRIRDHNPVADRYVRQYAQQAVAMAGKRRQRRAGRHDPATPARSPGA